MVVVHQPSIDIFFSFDALLLLARCEACTYGLSDFKAIRRFGMAWISWLVVPVCILAAWHLLCCCDFLNS